MTIIYQKITINYENKVNYQNITVIRASFAFLFLSIENCVRKIEELFFLALTCCTAALAHRRGIKLAIIYCLIEIILKPNDKIVYINIRHIAELPVFKLSRRTRILTLESSTLSSSLSGVKSPTLLLIDRESSLVKFEVENASDIYPLDDVPGVWS